MKLSWSHTVLKIKDKTKVLNFYKEVLGFTVTDEGEIYENGPVITFMSLDPNEHHQLALMSGREELDNGSSLDHVSFRVETYSELTEVKERLESAEHEYLPLCHGNALSFYFSDPEKNGIEIFMDTPWDVPQPQGEVWDPSLNEKEALSWVEETFKDKPGFVKRDDSKRPFVNR